MNTLIIYDNSGYIISQGQGAIREPVGIPFMWVEIPEGKRIKITDGIGVDTTVTPHQVILEDIPPTETEVLKQQISDLEAENAQINYALMMGGLI